MSYESYPQNSSNAYTNATWAYPKTRMQDDIAAIQHLYGGDFTYHAGITR